MKPGVIIAAVVGLLFCVAAILYFTQPAASLPGFLPGHAVGSTLHHTKHGVLALAVGVVCFVAAWFLSGPKQQAI